MLPPPNKRKCNGCSHSISVRQGFSYGNGGLIITRYNKLRDNILYLARQDFPSHCVRGEPLIHQVYRRPEEELCQGGGILETRGDVLIWGLWEIHTDDIIDIRFGDLDADTYKNEPMDKLLDFWDK